MTGGTAACQLSERARARARRGFGTVRYASKEDAEAAVEAMNNAQIGGRTVTVRIDRYA